MLDFLLAVNLLLRNFIWRWHLCSMNSEHLWYQNYENLHKSTLGNSISSIHSSMQDWIIVWPDFNCFDHHYYLEITRSLFPVCFVGIGKIRMCCNWRMEVLISGQIKMRDKASGEFVYQIKSSPSCTEQKLDTAMKIGMERTKRSSFN